MAQIESPENNTGIHTRIHTMSQDLQRRLAQATHTAAGDEDGAELAVWGIVHAYMQEHGESAEGATQALHAIAATNTAFLSVLDLLLLQADGAPKPDADLPDPTFSPLHKALDTPLALLAARVQDAGLPPAQLPQPEPGDRNAAALRDLLAIQPRAYASVKAALLQDGTLPALTALKWLLREAPSPSDAHLWYYATTLQPPQRAIGAVKALLGFEGWFGRPEGMEPLRYRKTVRAFKAAHGARLPWAKKLDPDWVHVLLVNRVALDPFDGGDYIWQWQEAGKVPQLLAIIRETPLAVLEGKDAYGWSLLSTAVAARAVPVVETLLARGVDPNGAADAFGTPALIAALGVLGTEDEAAEAMVDALMQAGARKPTRAAVQAALDASPLLSPHVVWRRYETLLEGEDFAVAAARHEYRGPSLKETLAALAEEGWVPA